MTRRGNVHQLGSSEFWGRGSIISASHGLAAALAAAVLALDQQKGLEAVIAAHGQCQ